MFIGEMQALRHRTQALRRRGMSQTSRRRTDRERQAIGDGPAFVDAVQVACGKSISCARGTDDEPLIDADTVRRTQQITADNLYVTALDTGDPSRDASRAEKLTDLLVPWDLMAYHDMGYSEFFKRKDVSREEIEAYIARLRVRFTRPEQVRKINNLEESWLAEWDEDHSVNHH